MGQSSSGPRTARLFDCDEVVGILRGKSKLAAEAVHPHFTPGDALPQPARPTIEVFANLSEGEKGGRQCDILAHGGNHTAGLRRVVPSVNCRPL